MASSIDRVKQSIRERLEEIEAERDQLLKALEALTDGSGGAAVGRRRGRPPGSGRGRGSSRRSSGKRAPRGQRRQQVIDSLQGGELGPSDIARQLGVNPTQVSGLLRQLASEGVVTRGESGKWRLTGASSPQPAGEPQTNGTPPSDQPPLDG